MSKDKHFPLMEVLGLLFVALKLTGFITWSWWVVLAPFWLPVTLILIVWAILYFICGDTVRLTVGGLNGRKKADYNWHN